MVIFTGWLGVSFLCICSIVNEKMVMVKEVILVLVLFVCCIFVHICDQSIFRSFLLVI